MCTCFLFSCIGKQKGAWFQCHLNEYLKTHSGPGVSPKYVTAPARAANAAMKSPSLCPQRKGNSALFTNDPLKPGKLCGVFPHANYMEFQLHSCSVMRDWGRWSCRNGSRCPMVLRSFRSPCKPQEPSLMEMKIGVRRSIDQLLVIHCHLTRWMIITQTWVKWAHYKTLSRVQAQAPLLPMMERQTHKALRGLTSYE